MNLFNKKKLNDVSDDEWQGFVDMLDAFEESEDFRDLDIGEVAKRLDTHYREAILALGRAKGLGYISESDFSASVYKYLYSRSEWYVRQLLVLNAMFIVVFIILAVTFVI